MKNQFYALVAVSLLVAGSAFAGHDGGVCKADIAKYCSQVEQGDGRVAHCLKEHKKDLSADCQKKMDEHMAVVKEMRDTCKADREKFCANSPKGEVGECMHEHKKEVSDSCQDAMKSMHKMKMENHGSHHSDSK